MRYVVDSRYFDGTCLTSMSDGKTNDYGEHETIEELRERENNQFLLPVSSERMDLLYKRYAYSLQLPFEEITEERYDDLMNCVPPLRMGHNWFYLGEEYSDGLHLLCFNVSDRYFSGLRSKRLSAAQIQQQISKHIKTISFRGTIIKGPSSRQSYGDTSNAKCVPYHFIGIDGKKHFLRNLFSETNDSFYEWDNRKTMTDNLLSLRRHNFKYWTNHGPDDIFEFFKWLREKKFTIQVGGELFVFVNRDFVDFHGNVMEYSRAFHYRIYDRELFALVINLLRTVKRQHVWRQ